jgi:hypothetical protein
MEIDPNRGDPVQVVTTVGILKIDAVPPLNDQGIGLHPLTLLGKGMPEVSAILGLKPLCAGLASHAGWAIIGRGNGFDNPRENYYNQRA